MKTSELTGTALDWAVAKAKGYAGFVLDSNRFVDMHETGHYNYSTDWALGGPIIEREGIEVTKGNPLYFPKGNENGEYYEPLWIAGKQHGQTPLIAAMRFYVASKLGDNIELPEGL